MPLLPPGHTAPMKETAEAPAIESAAPPPPPLAPTTAAAPPPPPVSPAIHRPPLDEEDEAPEVHLVEDGHVAQQPLTPPPVAAAPVEAPVAPPAAAPVEAPVEAPVAPAAAPPAPAAPVAAAPAVVPPAPSGMPAGTTGSSKVLKELEEDGFEGLDIGFGSFSTVRLQDQTFSTNDGETLGNTFLCVIHASKTKFLYKAADSNECDDFAYSYDKVTTVTGNKSIDELTAEWAAKGYHNPVWKKYLDVTAQLVDPNTRELGNLVILSIPNSSVPRLSGYITTLKIGQGKSVSSVVTQVYPGQKVTSSKKPFYPWAFKAYSTVQGFLSAS